MKYKYLFIVLGLLLVNCGPKKGIVTKKENQKTKSEIPTQVVKDRPAEVEPITKPIEEKPVKTKPVISDKTLAYVEAYANVAKEEMRLHKIPASITLAQGILESSSGKGRLATKANNHFGIKCHGWKGEKIYHDDDKLQECFRKYKEPTTSYRDHSKFLTRRGRYSNLFKLKSDDYRSWARGLKAAGYATDKAYANKLISLIERYELYRYDSEVLGVNADVETSTTTINSKVHTVIKGDTLYSLSKRYKTTVTRIMELNNLNSASLRIGQKLIIRIQ